MKNKFNKNAKTKTNPLLQPSKTPIKKFQVSKFFDMGDKQQCITEIHLAGETGNTEFNQPRRYRFGALQISKLYLLCHINYKNDFLGRLKDPPVYGPLDMTQII